MVATVYPGATLPLRVYSNNNNGLAQPTATQTAGATAPAGIGYLAPNDVIVVSIFMASSSTTVSSITVSGSSGLAFTRLSTKTQGAFKHEVWTTLNTTAQNGLGSVVVNLSASITAGVEVNVYNNTSSVSAAAVASAGTASTTLTATASAATVATNALVLMCVGTNTTGLSSMNGTAKPSYLMKEGTGGVYFRAFGWSGSNIAGAVTEILASPVFGAGYTPFVSQAIPSGTWATSIFYLVGLTVTLDDLQLQLTEAGPLLNNFTGAPIYDVDSITGLDDLSIGSTDEAIDGANGSYVNAKYINGRSVVIGGTIYANPPVDEAVIDNLKACASPLGGPGSTQLYTIDPPSAGGVVPLFYKVTNQNPRTLWVKPLGLSAPIDPARTRGNIPFQISAKSPDYTAYENGLAAYTDTGVAGLYTLNVPTGGNIDTYPIIIFQVTSADVTAGTPITIFPGVSVGVTTGNNSAWSRKYGYTPNALSIALTSGAGIYMLDLASRVLYFNISGSASSTSDVSGYVSNFIPFGLVAGQTNIISMQKAVGSTTEGFMVVYRNGWR